MRRRFVQFPHPGGEGGPDRTHWPRGDTRHVRKFLVAPGQYRMAIDGHDEQGEIAFWGEWEAPSECRKLAYASTPPPGGPRYVHRPQPPDRDRRPRGVPQNTDPFVFGDEFAYTFCGQRPNARKIRELAPGSVITFGSVRRDRFVCDTVFVVAEAILHTRADWRETVAPRVSDAVVAATLEPMYAWRPPEDRSYVLYLGASREDPVEGMFSFVPSLPIDGTPRGFARPTVDTVAGLSRSNKQAVAFNDAIGSERVPSLWRQVAMRVLDERLALGTRVHIPT